MNEIIIQALAKRVTAGQMTIAQVPEIMREAVEHCIDTLKQKLSVN